MKNSGHREPRSYPFIPAPLLRIDFWPNAAELRAFVSRVAPKLQLRIFDMASYHPSLSSCCDLAATFAVSWFGGGGGGTSPGIVGAGGGGSCFVNTALAMDLVVLQGTGRIPGAKRQSNRNHQESSRNFCIHQCLLSWHGRLCNVPDSERKAERGEVVSGMNLGVKKKKTGGASLYI